MSLRGSEAEPEIVKLLALAAHIEALERRESVDFVSKSCMVPVHMLVPRTYLPDMPEEYFRALAPNHDSQGLEFTKGSWLWMGMAGCGSACMCLSNPWVGGVGDQVDCPRNAILAGQVRHHQARVVRYFKS